MTENLINSGLSLTLYGMGTVFVFLVLLIYATRLMSWFALKIAVPQQQTENTTVDRADSANDTELVAVISAAVRQYRLSKRKP